MVSKSYLFPLSYNQERLWVLNQMELGNVAYNVPFAIKLDGTLDIAQLERALKEIANRHEILRTVYGMLEGKPQQVVLEENRIKLGIVDISDLSVRQQDIEAQQWLTQMSTWAFDLIHGPLFKVGLLKLAENEHTLAFNFHHIIMDEWSIGVFFRELKDLYEAYLTGREPTLEELPIQYGDYAVWQREWLCGEVLDRLVGYWKQKLEGLQGLELPTDHRRSGAQSFKGLIYRIDLQKRLTKSLKEFARMEGVTLNMLMLAVFKALLYRYTQQEDIVVGMPIGKRNPIELENLIGFFVNTLVVRTDLSGEPTFRELVQRVKETLLEAYDHQDLPFEKLVEVLNPERDLSRTPLFQVMFVMAQGGVGIERIGDMTISPLRVDTGTSKFDLTLFVEEERDNLCVSIEYSTDLFNADRIERMAGHYQRLLEDIVEHPEKKIWELELLTEKEKHQVLVEWNDTDVDYPKDKCLHQLFEEQVERTPEAVAVVFGEQQLTYRELNERANQLGHYLQKLGVGPEVLVGICVERSLEMIVGLLGILKAGGAYVPLDPSYPKERLQFMLADAQAPVLLTQATLNLNLATKNTCLVYLDQDWHGIAHEGIHNVESGIQPDNLIYVIYTSGSTGKPKGAMNIHVGVVNRLLWMQSTFGLKGTDRVLQKTPFSFDVSVWELFLPLFTGAQLVFAKPDGHKDPSYLAELIDKSNITTIHFVPSMLKIFLGVHDLTDRCSSLQRVICSGEALSFDLQEQYFATLNAGLYNLYGPTEAAVDVAWWSCRSGNNLRTVPIGYPIANTQIYILDSHFNPVPVGIPGELYIGGIQVGRGYLNRPELTRERFTPNPFEKNEKSRLYKTGDEVKWHANGSIEYLGRLDFQVKIRGNRIELDEIEKTIREIETVSDALVLAVESERGELSIFAYIVALNDPGVDMLEFLRLYLKTKLPEYMLPSVFVFLDALPLTPNGKVDRKALLAMSKNHPVHRSSKTYIAPRTRTERLLAEIWSDVLHTGKISVNDDFFDLGGNSLLLMQVLFQIQKLFRFELTISILFDTTQLEDLAKRIDMLPKKLNEPIKKSERVLRDMDFSDVNSSME